MDKDISRQERIERDTANEIFTNSPPMLALCLTVIGLIKIYTTLQCVTTLMDNCLAIGVVAFFVSTISSYLAIRASTAIRRIKLGRIADYSFLTGLGCAAAVAIMVTFTFFG